MVAHGGVPPYPETREFVRRVMSRLGKTDHAVASAPAGRVASLRFPSPSATVRRPLKRDPAAPGVAPAVVRVSLDDMPHEPLALAVDLPRDADLPHQPADWAQEAAERRLQGTPARNTDVLADAVPPSSRRETQAP